MSDAQAVPRHRPPTRREAAPGAVAPPASSASEAGELAAPPSLAHAVYNRAAFGPQPGDLAAFEALGADDDSRLAAWVAAQLAPNDLDDPDYLDRRHGNPGLGIPDPGFVTLDKTLGELWADHQAGSPPQPSRPVDETRLDTLTRMVYSRWQLRELLVDFWMNHFNVYGFENYTRSTFVYWDREVVRANLFGNFRAMLESGARSATMLYYLDNYTNTRSGPNENYARELIELHTLGAISYWGVGQADEVPAGAPWPAGAPDAGLPAPAGYVDNDVYEATRILTGWGVDGATGAFLYTDSNHDRFAKSVLAFGVQNFPADRGEIEGADLFDLLAAHPGTGRHLATKLCRRLIADDPPAGLVDTVAALFTAQWQAPDQLAQVYQAILISEEFKTTWGGKTKRPVEFLVSAMRAVGANWLFGYTSQAPLTLEPDTSSLLSRLSKTGQNLFSRVPPDGYPDRTAAWISTNTRVQCWRLAGWLVDQDIDGVGGTDDFRLDVIGVTHAAFPPVLPDPVPRATTDDLVDFWIERILGRTLPAVEREEIVDFMAAGANPGFLLDLTQSNVKSRLRSMVALVLMTPEFLVK